jgi:hypothetical protein
MNVPINRPSFSVKRRRPVKAMRSQSVTGSRLPVERLTAPVVATAIHQLRHQRVLLDADLAVMYGVSTGALNQAVKRNRARFPDDFMFQLTADETTAMRSQTVTASKRNVGALPYAFTEQGVAMLSGVLRSPRAIRVNIAIMRAFVAMRRVLAEHTELAKRLETLEHAVRKHKAESDHQTRLILETIQALISDDYRKPGKIGFQLS